MCWCPGGSLLERARANGPSLYKEIVRDREKLTNLQRVASARARNEEIAHLRARGNQPAPPPRGRPKPHGSDYVAFVKGSRLRPVWDQPRYWPEAWSESVSVLALPATNASAPVPPNPEPDSIIASHGQIGLPVTWKRSVEFDSITDGYEEFSSARRHRIMFARLYRRGIDDKIVLEYGWGGGAKQLEWRSIRVPKQFRTPPKKRR